MHPEADAFLDAIFDQPDDDTPRLVYADWLQEHGYEDYAQFIRLSCRLEREVMPREERNALRQSRYEQWNRMVQANPLAFADLHLHVSSYHRGIMYRDLQFRADTFVRNAEHWWPVVHPQYLGIIEASGFEPLIARHAYLRRARALTCSGSFREMRWGANRRERAVLAPLTGELLLGLAAAEGLARLEALRLEPLFVSVRALSVFARSVLVNQLAACELVLLCADGEEIQLDAHGEPGNGHLREAIEDFLAAYAERLPRD